MASPILRETIKKLRERRAELQKQIKGPLAELRQIEADLQALGASAAARNGDRRRGAAAPARTARRKTAGAAAPPGTTQRAILRAIRNGATTPEEIAGKTSIAGATVNRSLANSITKQKLVTRGLNGLTLTKAGRDRLAELEAE